jgi:putative ABC transport system ATP-binding protein
MLLRTSKLVKVYRADGVTVEAVRGVDIELGIGEFVAIMGPSGSGKSTLLHVLGGLEPATSGEIWLRGQRVDGLSTAAWAILRRQHIGFVFQFFNLLSNMTVADNVELPALLAGATRGRPERREELLAELGISPGGPPRPGCPAGSSSAWRWRARWPTSRASCSPTSRPATWTAPTRATCSGCCAGRMTGGRRS